MTIQAGLSYYSKPKFDHSSPKPIFMASFKDYNNKTGGIVNIKKSISGTSSVFEYKNGRIDTEEVQAFLAGETGLITSAGATPAFRDQFGNFDLFSQDDAHAPTYYVDYLGEQSIRFNQKYLYNAIDTNTSVRPVFTYLIRFSVNTVDAFADSLIGSDNGSFDCSIFNSFNGVFRVSPGNVSPLALIGIPALTGLLNTYITMAVSYAPPGSTKSKIYYNYPGLPSPGEIGFTSAARAQPTSTYYGSSRANQFAFDGYISHVAIYNKILTLDEFKYIDESLNN